MNGKPDRPGTGRALEVYTVARSLRAVPFMSEVLGSLTHRAVSSLLLATLLLAVTAAGVSAKLDATLSPDRARPGDRVTMTTGAGSEGVSQGGQPVPVYLLPGVGGGSTGSCEGPGSTLLGLVSWDHATGVGKLAFRVPAVRAAGYTVAVQAPNASPGCWPEATLTVVAALPATDTAEPPRAANLPWLVVAAAALVGALAGGLWAGRRASVP